MGTLPAAVTVSGCDATAPMLTLPKLIEFVLSLNAEACPGDKVTLKVLETPPAVAVIVAV
jgi:hypothetical protein